MAPAKDIATLIPADPLMAVAWYSCLMCFVKKPGVIERFREDTGCNWTPATNVLDRMIDEQCGADFDFAKRFLEWFNENVWGDLNLKAGEEAADVDK